MNGAANVTVPVLLSDGWLVVRAGSGCCYSIIILGPPVVTWLAVKLYRGGALTCIISNAPDRP